jgi:hypothetical protein
MIELVAGRGGGVVPLEKDRRCVSANMESKWEVQWQFLAGPEDWWTPREKRVRDGRQTIGN